MHERFLARALHRRYRVLTFGQTSLKSFVVTTRAADEEALSSFGAPLMASTG
jgi:hypothetical protein